jgi:hypothetical protein
MAEQGNPDYIELMRLLGEAKPILEPMFPDQKTRWVGESALAEEIMGILARHPEFYDDVAARLGNVFPKPKAKGTGA